MRNKFKCMDCGQDVGKIGEHSMLHDGVWLSIHNSPHGMLCIKCIETRLGRRLNKNDFNDSHINKPFPGKYFSTLLANRLNLII